MAYDRYEGRGGWREPRSRFARDYQDRSFERRGFDRDFDREGRDERGFFERAGDEVASWFGDEEAEQRRREDERMRQREYGRGAGSESSREGGRPRAFMSGEEYSHYDRHPRFRDEGYRRPYTGRFVGRRGSGDDDRFDRGFDRPDFTGSASGLHDPHYGEWRRRQIDALDRDYDEYRRENQSRFESDFSNWRTTRQGKRQLLGNIREHMAVVGSDDEQIGTVDCVRGDRIVLTKGDSPDDRHHSLSCGMVDRVEGDRVILDQPAAEAKRRFEGEGRDRWMFDRDEEPGEDGRILNRSFSGTYER